MIKTGNKIKVIFAGRLPEDNISSGPLITAENIFAEYSSRNSSVFIRYFFDGRRHSVLKKLFGRETQNAEHSRILTLGLFRIIPELLRGRPDIIHLITFERFALVFCLYKLFFRVKIIYNSHGIIQHENSEFKKLTAWYRFRDKFCERIFLKYSDKIIFPSVFAMDIAEKYYNLDEKKAVILPNGVSDIFFADKREHKYESVLRAVIHYKNEYNISGRELLEKSLSSIKSQVEIHVITNQDLTTANTENITFFKHSMMPPDKLQEFYLDKDIFLSLNKYDTFSISTAEAMASGLIPVVTIQTGISRYIQNGVNGFVFDHFDITRFAGIINALSRTAFDKRNETGMAASKTVKELKWSNIYMMYDKLYTDISI